MCVFVLNRLWKGMIIESTSVCVYVCMHVAEVATIASVLQGENGLYAVRPGNASWICIVATRNTISDGAIVLTGIAASIQTEWLMNGRRSSISNEQRNALETISNRNKLKTTFRKSLPVCGKASYALEKFVQSIIIIIELAALRCGVSELKNLI